MSGLLFDKLQQTHIISTAMQHSQKPTQSRLKQLQKRFHFNPSAQTRINTSNTTKSTKRKISDIIIRDQNGEFSSVKEKNDFNDSSWLAKLVNGIQDTGRVGSQGGQFCQHIEGMSRDMEERKHGFTITRNSLDDGAKLVPRKSVPNLGSNRLQLKSKQNNKLSCHSIVSQSDQKQNGKPKKSYTKQSQKCLSQQSQNSIEPKSKLSKIKSIKQIQHQLNKISPKLEQKKIQNDQSKGKGREKENERQRQKQKQKDAHKNSLINYSSIQEEDRNFQIHREEDIVENLEFGVATDHERKQWNQDKIVIDLDLISLKTEGERDTTPVQVKFRDDGSKRKYLQIHDFNPKQKTSNKKQLQKQKNQSMDEDWSQKQKNLITNRKRTQSLKSSQLYKPTKQIKNEKMIKKNSGKITINNSIPMQIHSKTKNNEYILIEKQKQKQKQKQFNTNTNTNTNSNAELKPQKSKESNVRDTLMMSKEETRNSNREFDKDKQSKDNTREIRILSDRFDDGLGEIKQINRKVDDSVEKENRQVQQKQKDVFSSWNQFLDTFKYQQAAQVKVGAIKKNRGKKSADMQGMSKLDIKDVIIGSFSDQTRIPTFNQRQPEEIPKPERVQNTRECPTKKNSISLNSPLKQNPIRKQYIEQKSISTIKKGQQIHSQISSNTGYMNRSLQKPCQQFSKQSPKFNYAFRIPEQHTQINYKLSKQKKSEPEQIFRKLDEKKEKKIYKQNCNQMKLNEEQKYQIGSIISKIKYMGKVFTMQEFVHQYGKLCGVGHNMHTNQNVCVNGVGGYHTFQPRQRHDHDYVRGGKGQYSYDKQSAIRSNKTPLQEHIQPVYQIPLDPSFRPLFPQTIHPHPQSQDITPSRSPYLQKSSTAYINQNQQTIISLGPTTTPLLSSNNLHQVYNHRHVNIGERGDIGSIIDHLNSKLSNYIQHNNLEDTFRKFKLEFVQLRRNMHY